MLYFENGFIIFGGWDTRSIIARLDLSTTSWTKLGNLKVGRAQHNVIYDGDVFIIVGGLQEGSFPTENCSLSGSTMACIEQSPVLTGYHYYPLLAMVPEDFCTEDCS